MKMCGIFSLLFILVLYIGTSLVNGEPMVPCYFIFGDSLSDPGNNNELATVAKANYKPYGVDFPGGVPTGRFTNGRNIVDFNSQFLGFEKFIPPYNSSQMGEDILRGVNYASGSAGILEETGYPSGDRLWLDRQIKYYKATIKQLESMIEEPVSNYLSKCLYSVNMGSNDYINNYLLPQYFNSSKLYNPEQYAELLITRYKAQLQKIYDSGARKIVVYGLGKIGCTPAEMRAYKSSECVEEINQAVDLFNKKLISLVDYFNANIRDGKFTFINLSVMHTYLNIFVPNPGFILNPTCCTLRSDGFLCEASSKPCLFRSLYQYMDAFHPTEFVNRLAATASFYTTPLSFLVVHPMSIRQLVNTKLEQM